MYTRYIAAASALAAGATAQFASYSNNGVQYSVNIPSSTSSSKSGPIYIQMLAPSGTQWLGLGQGTHMAGANMFVMYTQSSTNITISPRSGLGEFEPLFDSSAQVTVLEGSGITSDGKMLANIRCDSCLSWSGGSMDPTDTSSSWIWAIKLGSNLDTSDTSADISQHDTFSFFNLDLTSGTGGSSSNPFIAAAASGSATSATAGSTATSGSSPSSSAVATGPVATSTGSSGSGSTGGFTVPVDTTRAGHAAVMSVVFLVFFPLFGLTLYLPFASRVRYVHAPLQIFSIILLIIGLALGVKLGKSTGQLDHYHQIIGYIVVAVMIGFQPALGIYQHLYYHRTGGRSPLGVVHQWLGRTVIIAGVVNGGLGFLQSGPVGTSNVPHYSVVLYSIVAVVVFIIYVAVVVSSKFRNKSASPQEKISSNVGYEMHPSSNDTYDPSGQGRDRPAYQSSGFTSKGRIIDERLS